MFCENCHARIANVHIMKIINGEKTETHLCSECAANKNQIHSYTDMSEKMFNSFSGKGFISDDFFEKCQNVFESIEENNENNRANRLLGSELNYKKFRNNLKKSIDSQHQNQIEDEINDESQADSILIDLKNQLKKCIETEDYEKAAQIRDKIKVYKDEHYIQ